MQLQGFWQLPNNGKLSDPNSTTVNTPPKMPKGMDSNGPCFLMFFVGHLMIHDDSTLFQQKNCGDNDGEKSYHSSGARLKKKLCHQEALMAQKAQTSGCLVCFSSFSLSKYLGRNKL